MGGDVDITPFLLRTRRGDVRIDPHSTCGILRPFGLRMTYIYCKTFSVASSVRKMI